MGSIFGGSGFVTLLMVYQYLWVIQCQSQPCKRKVGVRFNLELRTKMFHTFPKGINQKVKLIARLEFLITYFDVKVLHFRHNVTGTLLEQNHIGLTATG